MAQGRPSSKEEAGSQRGGKAEERMRCMKAISQAKQGECGTTQDGLAGPLVNGRE